MRLYEFITKVKQIYPYVDFNLLPIDGDEVTLLGIELITYGHSNKIATAVDINSHGVIDDYMAEHAFKLIAETAQHPSVIKPYREGDAA